MSEYDVSSGQTSSGLSLSGIEEYRDYEYVLSGGISIGTTINDDAIEEVDSGGFSERNFVNCSSSYYSNPNLEIFGSSEDDVLSAGTIEVFNGGVIRSESVFDGEITINGGGSAVAVAISGYGGVIISSGGSAVDVTISAGALYINSGGYSTDDVVFTRGVIELGSGAELSSSTVMSGGVLSLGQGAEGSAVTVSRGGSIGFGGFVVSSGQVLTVQSAGVQSAMMISGITVLSGAKFYYDGVRIDRRGTLSLEPGDSVEDVTVSGGGVVKGAGALGYVEVEKEGLVEGAAVLDNLDLSSGGIVRGVSEITGYLFLSAGGVIENVGNFRNLDSDTQVYGLISGATLDALLYIESGGVTDDLRIEGGDEELVGGTASGTRVIGPRAFQYVDGVASATTLLLSGRQEVSVSGSVFGVVLDSGASQTVDAGGYSSGVILRTGAQALDFGDEVDVKVLAGGTLTLDSSDADIPTSATEVRIFSGGQVDVTVGSISHVIVQSGGVLALTNHAKASDVIVRAGGIVLHDYDIDYGHFASDVIVSSGAYLSNSGTVNSATILGGGYLDNGGVVRDATIIGEAYLNNYDFVSNVTIFSGAYLSNSDVVSNATILSGAIDYNSDRQYDTVVSAGGQELLIRAVDTGTTLIGVAGGDPPSSSRIGELVGLQVVIDGVASRTTVSSGGYQRLGYDGASFNGGTAYDTTVLSGGVVEVDAEAALSGATIDSGGELLIYDHYQAISGIALKAGAEIALGDQDASSASFSGGKLVISSGGMAIESFTVSGGGAGLAVSVTSGTDGQTLLTITSAATAQAALVETAAQFGAGPAPFGAFNLISTAAHAGYIGVEPGGSSGRHATG